MPYKYALVVYKKNVDAHGLINNIKIKRFIGNDKALLMERFEMWFLKQGFSRYEIELNFDGI